jgi:lipocalin
MPDYPPLPAVKALEIRKYLGTWYEIARIPARFQKDCVAVTATYSLRPDGKIKVYNACRLKTLEGPEKSITGKAWVPNPDQPGKLKVSFFSLFSADYWILDLDRQYNYAVVGGPKRKYLWILSRTPLMSETIYNELIGQIKTLGYDVDLIKKTLQVRAMTEN